ncbi:MAG: PD-(D/E)XK nuclease-like domain-containing protein [Fretibacterium sp.]|nr:PD-(D/E)XK nuclease-like domain-containing protein [Fretibacterium sp.]
MNEGILPGLYAGIGNEEYHAGPGLSSSDLKELSRSPLHYRAAKENPEEPTESMKFGTAVHCSVLEPELFDEIYVRGPEGDKRTKAVKEAWAAIEAEGKIPLSHDDFEAIQGITRSIREHPLASRWLSGGTAEQSGFWQQHVRTDSFETDILCKCRPDYIKEAGNHYVIVDLKTTKDASPGYFARAAYWDYKYHISAAHYLTGMEAILDERAQGFIFVSVEKQKPYALNVFQAGEDFLRAGFEVNKGLYETYASCLLSGEWPSYPTERLELNLPRGARF